MTRPTVLGVLATVAVAAPLGLAVATGTVRSPRVAAALAMAAPLCGEAAYHLGARRRGGRR